MLTFLEISKLAAIIEYDEKALAAFDPATCPRRGEIFKRVDHEDDAICNALGPACGRSVAIDESTCRMCLAHGKADAAVNGYFKRQVLALAWTGCVASPLSDAPVTPDAATLAVSVDNVKALAGEAVAVRFIEALIYHESVTPEDAAALVLAHDLPLEPA